MVPVFHSPLLAQKVKDYGNLETSKYYEQGGPFILPESPWIARTSGWSQAPMNPKISPPCLHQSFLRQDTVFPPLQL